MQRFYSQSTGNTYLQGIHAEMPSDAVPITEDIYLSVIASANSRKVRGHNDGGLPVLIDPPPEPLDDLAARKRAELNTARDEAFAAGLPYEIDGQQDIVQTRPQDQINLLGLNAKATRLISSGNADTLMEFRGQSNVSHWIDAHAMDDLTMAALSYIEDIYQQSWERKDALDAAHKAEDREAIEAVVW